MPSVRIPGMSKGIFTMNVPDATWLNRPPVYSDADKDKEVLSFVNWQFECGANGNYHWQGYFECALGSRKSFNQMNKLLFANYPANLINTTHYTAVVTNNGASEYALKDETCVDPRSRYQWGVAREKGTKKTKLEDHKDLVDLILAQESWSAVLKCDHRIRLSRTWAQDIWNHRPKKMKNAPTHLRSWQKEVYEKLMAQDNREILFVIDFEGNNGKTAFCKWLFNRNPDDLFIIDGGQQSDIIHAYNDQTVVAYDFARASEAEKWPYRSMEKFKDGYGLSTKYQSSMKVFPECKIVVFCNTLPCWHRLSKDRWVNSRIFLSQGVDTDYPVTHSVYDLTMHDMGPIPVEDEPENVMAPEVQVEDQVPVLPAVPVQEEEDDDIFDQWLDELVSE